MLIRLANLARQILSDVRLQIVFTIPVPRFSCSMRLEELVTSLRLPYISWDRALHESFDLAISSTALEEFADLKCPMLILSHGPGHTKTISLASKSLGHKDWLTHRRDNYPYREIILASHEERRIFPSSSACEYTAIGDVEFDALYASMSRRSHFRNVLKTGDRMLVTLSSTWHDNSLFGRNPQLIGNLLSTYPANQYCFALILHPSVWITHGEWQIKTWLRNSLNAGLRLIPYERGWQAAIIAADRVIGDYGSVSLYSNMLDIPTCFYQISKHDMNTELTIVREALQGHQAHSTQDVMDFINKRPLTSTAKSTSRHKAFANLGCAAESLAKTIYQRIGLTYDANSVRASFVDDPDFNICEPNSFHVCFSDEEDPQTLLYPASLHPPLRRNSTLISTDSETNYRICQSADGALLEASGASRWWKDRFPTATHALIKTGHDYTLTNREEPLRKIGPVAKDEAFSILAKTIASERTESS